MPGIVIFRRRWSVGSDDLVLPGIFLFLVHTTWFVVLAVVLFGLTYNPQETCSLNLVDHGRGYLGILMGCMISEVAIIWLSMRGSILYTEPRDSMQYILYIRLAILVIEFVYAIIGIIWLVQYYHSCHDTAAKNVTLGIVACNWVVILSVCITVMCVFDRTGRTFVKLRATKRRQRNLRTYNLRHRLEEEQASSWSRRLKFFLCCTRAQDSQSDAYSEVAFLFAEFFRDLDIVPSDIIAGLVLLRQRQRAKRNAVLDEANNDILAFLSGIPVTRNTKYLDLKNSQEMYMYKETCYYMHFALAAYGWPMYLMRNPTCGLCKLASSCSCCCFCLPRPRYAPSVTVEEDNCCSCNVIAIKRHFVDEDMPSVDIVYTSCHDAVFETPFYVAVDHDKKKVVISIRGTLSPKDALTDLTGDAERLPVEGHHGTWLGHKGMVLSAEYIKKKLEQEMILSQAFGRDLGKGTKHYGLVVVGHSLGAGTAAILSFLLRPHYPTLQCFAYSPPGGLLSDDAMEYSKEFVTAVVLGKDLVPRIGLSQLEGFRRHLLEVLQKSNKPKWRIIVGGTRCIPKSELPEDVEETSVQNNRQWAYPSDLTIALSASVPLYPPGRIIHVVHNHPEENCCCGQEEPTYYAIWSDNKTLDEVIISPAMLNEHMPHVVMDGLHKVLENYNKGKTALLGAAMIMVSPTEVDLNPDMITQQQPQSLGQGDHKRNSGMKTKSNSELSFEALYQRNPNILCQKDPVELLLMNTKERLANEVEERRAPLAMMESLSDNESNYSFDSRRSSGFRSIRGSPSLHVVMEKDESHCFYIDPAIPEENPSLSSRTELLAADSLSKHSQEVQHPEPLHNSCYSLPSHLLVESEEDNEATVDADSLLDKLPMEDDSKESLREAPSPQVLEFAEFIDSLFNLDGKSSSFQDIYHMVLDDSLEDYNEIPKSVSEHEILARAQFEPNLVPKPPRLFAGSTDAGTSSGISVSPSFPFSSSGELMDITPTCMSSQECLTMDTKLRTSTPAEHQPNSNKAAEFLISAL
ncbi:diacylglycerol lipase-alpha [Callorhinchus milii]|uniref:diacylglycerol lipase-alpha n=1 Tax=Callorhinchus milii TaxID=7868 RepID=UPI001C3F6667|nr:diacylglycerol lipase-alpha [Callorhinchus milii]XP_007885646.2 diacylglycerol lipase-alpha [Callorhinchus milii]XP_007885647.2 diacylglycerol lipase-alpha [Callorhinchus milii]XP_007885648.2 diacylglycerol lipase-alpha [Callorhinchus milii]XP_007885649.2 diacylglycerol lipase-alpha [Callorhinchus milii]XP_042197431.1 diacylglycerol lipase-alpha [Callorhinchus milii]